MRKLVFAIMLLFVIFSLLKGVAETNSSGKLASGEKTESLSGVF